MVYNTVMENSRAPSAYKKHDIIYDNKQSIPSVIPKPPSASSETLSHEDAEGSKVYLPISGLGDSRKAAILLLNRPAVSPSRRSYDFHLPFD